MLPAVRLSAAVLISLSSALLLAGEDEIRDKGRPCKSLKLACESAGYHVSGHTEGKGLHKDCLRPLLAGQVPDGVVVADADVEACRGRKWRRAEKRGRFKADAQAVPSPAE